MNFVLGSEVRNLRCCGSGSFAVNSSSSAICSTVVHTTHNADSHALQRTVFSVCRKNYSPCWVVVVFFRRLC